MYLMRRTIDSFKFQPLYVLWRDTDRFYGIVWKSSRLAASIPYR